MKLAELLAIASLGGIVACGSTRAQTDLPGTAPKAIAEAGPAAEAPAPPALRLPDTVKPRHYDVALTLRPEAERFQGTIDIDLELSAATDVIWLNATRIDVQQATLSAGDEKLPARVVPGGEEFLGFAFARPVGPGPARLSIRYSGAVERNGSDGIFAESEGGDFYQFTQFEATSARRAFPCFDEPRFKVPWQLRLTVAKDQTALANTPVVSETDAGNGTKVVTFAETRPLPSYLVAFAVGPFDLREAGETRHGVPIRIVAPRGRAGQTAYAAEVTGRIVAVLEDYVGIPYPYKKLDIVTIPNTVGFGAMENPGLVTFNQAMVLWKPEEETITRQKRYGIVAMHELAHQWFGDLVTMPWWDEIWLNESFASWLESKLTGTWHPDWDADVSAVGDKMGAVYADSLASARRIREPIRTKDDVANAFDSISYIKGQSVLRMFEQWIGPETFQKGIREYLRDHADGVATSEDFLAAIDKAAGRDVDGPFSTFLEQVGVPSIRFALRCEPGAKPALELSQKRFLPLGSKAAADQVWQVPVCVEYPAGGKVAKACTLLTEASGNLELAAATSCPAWIQPNADGIGYYLSDLQGDLGDHLLAAGMKSLSVAEQVSLIGDFRAQVESGDAPVARSLALVDRLARSDNRHIIDESVMIVRGIDEIVPEALRPNYARFIRKVFGRRALALGWAPKKGEDPDTTQLRPTVVGMVAARGDDPRLVEDAEQLAWKWLQGRKGVDPTMIDVVLAVAAKNGDRKLFDALNEQVRTESNRLDRGRLFAALGSFEDPALAKDALAVFLDDGVEAREAIPILLVASMHRATRSLAWDFVRTHYDAIAARMPEKMRPRMPFVASGFCDESHREDARAFFTGRTTELAGGPRVLAQALERISLCSAYRAKQEASVAAFLEKY